MDRLGNAGILMAMSRKGTATESPQFGLHSVRTFAQKIFGAFHSWLETQVGANYTINKQMKMQFVLLE